MQDRDQHQDQPTTMQVTNDDPKASGTILVGLVGAIFVFVIIVALQALFYNAEEAERVAKVYSQAPAEVSELRARQQEQLNSYRWVDPAQSRVAIPIDRAMDLVVRDLNPTGGSQERPSSPRNRSAAAQDRPADPRIQENR